MRKLFFFAVLVLIFAAPSFAQVTLSVPVFQYPIQGQDYNPNYSGATYAGTGGMVLNILTGMAPFSCAVTSGAIPTSMTLAEVTPTSTPLGGCVIKGTPTANGDFTFTLQVTDANSNTASQSVTVPVLTSSPATFSAPSCPTPTASGVTCTWTTSVATTTQLCYGTGNALPKCGTPGSLTPFSGMTTETDLSGVTSHSVTLTGLASSANYFIYFLGRGISGSAQDYLFAWYDPSCTVTCGTSFFTTAAAASAGSADFGLQMFGPHNILQGGYPLYVAIFPWPLAGTTDISGHNVVYQITGIPTNSKVHWPDQQDNGGSIGTVTTTTTPDDTITLSSPNFVIVQQFEILTNVGGTTPVGNYTLTLHVTGGGTPTVHTFTWAMNVSAPSFTFGSPSSQPAIPALSTWQNNFSVGTTKWATPGGPQGVCSFGAFNVGFYDGSWAFYQIGMFTGNPSPWGQQARTCSQNYQNAEINVTGSDTNWQNAAIYVFPHGQYYECKNFGNSTACNGVHALLHCCGGSMLANSLAYATGDFARESAWMLNAKRLDYDLGGGTTTLAQVQTMATYVLGNIDQYTNEDQTVLNESFMAGLLMQSAIEFYVDPNTGNGDARVPQAVCGLADQMWSTWWVPWDGANGGFPYEHRTWTGLNHQGSSAFGYNGAVLEDLNNLIAPAYAWCYLITGNQKYQLEGDTIFNSSVLEPTNVGIAALGKTWTQGYRWSALFVGWRGGLPNGLGVGCFLLPQTGTCPRVQLPVATSGSPTL